MEPNTAPLSNYCAASYTKHQAQTVSLVKSLIDFCNENSAEPLKDTFFEDLADDLGKATHTGITGNRINEKKEHPAITIMYMLQEFEPVPTKHYKKIADYYKTANQILTNSINSERLDACGVD